MICITPLCFNRNDFDLRFIIDHIKFETGQAKIAFIKDKSDIPSKKGYIAKIYKCNNRF